MTDIQQSPQLLRLCELASKEHDPQKLVRLILKINQKLDELMGESELSLPEAADWSRPTIPLSMFVDRKLKFGVVPSAQRGRNPAMDFTCLSGSFTSLTHA